MSCGYLTEPRCNEGKSCLLPQRLTFRWDSVLINCVSRPWVCSCGLTTLTSLTWTLHSGTLHHWSGFLGSNPDSQSWLGAVPLIWEDTVGIFSFWLIFTCEVAVFLLPPEKGWEKKSVLLTSSAAADHLFPPPPPLKKIIYALLLLLWKWRRLEKVITKRKWQTDFQFFPCGKEMSGFLLYSLVSNVF